jgi:hypothetical protein
MPEAISKLIRWRFNQLNGRDSKFATRDPLVLETLGKHVEDVANLLAAVIPQTHVIYGQKTLARESTRSCELTYLQDA